MPKTVQPLRVLILGGTGFIGPHFVDAAVAAGHSVAVFNRGASVADLPEGVERLQGDRASGDYASIRDRDWDVAIDLAVYDPEWVTSLGEAMAGRIAKYVYLSSMSVYENDDSAPVRNELSPLKQPLSREVPLEADSPWDQVFALPFHLQRMYFDRYGLNKQYAEIEAEKYFPGRTISIRPHCLVAPGDNSNHLYWYERILKGGEVLVPGDPTDGFQLIDVRDMASWTIQLVEDGEAGIFNCVSPDLSDPIAWGDYIDQIGRTADNGARLTWVSSKWLLDEGVAQHLLPLWFPYPDRQASETLEWTAFNYENTKAVEHGLTYRPWQESVADTVEWARTTSTGLPEGWGISPDLESKLLSKWHAETADKKG